MTKFGEQLDIEDEILDSEETLDDDILELGEDDDVDEDEDED